MGNRAINAERRFDFWGRTGLYDGLVLLAFGRAGKRLRAELVADLRLDRAAHVLDVGTGTGEILPALAAAVPFGEVVGIDLSAAMLDRARVRIAGVPNARVVRADVSAGLPFASNSFDAAISTYALSCVVDLEAALREIVRVLRPGGVLGVVEAAHVNVGPAAVGRTLTRLLSPVNAWYPERDLDAALAAAGLERVRETVAARGALRSISSVLH